METGNGSVSNEGILHMNNYAQDTKFKNVGIHCWTVFSGIQFKKCYPASKD